MIHFFSNPMIPACRKAKRQPAFLAQIAIFFLVFLITTLATSVLVAIPAVFVVFTAPEMDLTSIIASPSMTLVSLFLTILTTAGALIYCLCIEKRSGLSMGFRKKTLWKSYGKGLLIGTGLLLLCSGISLLLGGFTIEFAQKISLGYILLFFVGYVIQGSSEEILLRGYFMMSLSNRCSMPLAVGLSSVVFSLLHVFNPGFGVIPLINITLFGIFMGVYVLREGDLWGACAIHSAWNFVQGNIVGMQVSGTAHAPTLLQMQPVEGLDLLNGGSFGIEGSLIVTVILLISIALTLCCTKKHHSEA